MANVSQKIHRRTNLRKLQLANLFVKEWGREYTTLLLKAVTVKPISENKQKGGKTLTNL